jgi:hypothetical protein
MDRSILLVIAAAAALGCKQNRTSIEIRGRAFPSDTSLCKYSATGDFQLGPGQLDVSATRPNYFTALYVTNNNADPTVTTPGTAPGAKGWRPSAIKVRINPSDYTREFPPVPDLLPIQVSNRIPVTGNVVEPNGGQGIVVGEIISSAMGAQLATVAGARGNVVVGVTIEGQTLDGAALDTGEWFFPIDVCLGCRAGGSLSCGPGTTKAPSCCPGGAWQDICVCQ